MIPIFKAHLCTLVSDKKTLKPEELRCQLKCHHKEESEPTIPLGPTKFLGWAYRILSEHELVAGAHRSLVLLFNSYEFRSKKNASKTANFFRKSILIMDKDIEKHFYIKKSYFNELNHIFNIILNNIDLSDIYMLLSDNKETI